MAAKKQNLTGDWREQLLTRAQAGFERYLQATLKDIDRVEARLKRSLETVKGDDAKVRGQMLRAEIRQVAGIRKKTKELVRQSRLNFRQQLSGDASLNVEAISAGSGTPQS